MPSLVVLVSLHLFEGSIDPNPRGRHCLVILFLQPCDPGIAVHRFGGKETLRPLRLGEGLES